MEAITSHEFHNIAVAAAWNFLEKNQHHYIAAIEAIEEAAKKGKLSTLIEVYDETVADSLITVFTDLFYMVKREDVITLDSDMFQIENSKTIQLKIEW